MVVYRKMPNAGAPMDATDMEQLVERVDAQQVLLRHEQRHGGHHGGTVERLPDAAHDDEHHEQRNDTCPNRMTMPSPSDTMPTERSADR